MSTITTFGDRIKTNLKSALLSVNKAGLMSDAGSGGVQYLITFQCNRKWNCYINPIMNLFAMEPMRKTGERTRLTFTVIR